MENNNLQTSPNNSQFVTFLLALLHISRIGRSLLACVIVYFMSESLGYTVMCLFFLLFSFTFNDAVDFEPDKKAHPDRPLQKGHITQATVFTTSLVLLLTGFLSTYWLTPEYKLLFLAFCSVSALYSYALKPMVPAVATPIWCLLVTFVLLSATNLNIWAYIIVFSIFYAKEILLDYRDKEADKITCRTPSIPVLLGKTTFLYALAFVILGIISAWIIHNNPMVIIGVGIFLVVAVATYFLLSNNSQQRENQIVKLTCMAIELSFPFVLLIKLQ